MYHRPLGEWGRRPVALERLQGRRSRTSRYSCGHSHSVGGPLRSPLKCNLSAGRLRHYRLTRIDLRRVRWAALGGERLTSVASWCASVKSYHTVPYTMKVDSIAFNVMMKVGFRQYQNMCDGRKRRLNWGLLATTTVVDKLQINAKLPGNELLVKNQLAIFH